MNKTLTQEDKNYIQLVVRHAVEKAGSHHQLFSHRLEFIEDSGRIRFNWPVWMLAIKSYLIYRYGPNHAESMLVDILQEVNNKRNDEAYLLNHPLNNKMLGQVANEKECPVYKFPARTSLKTE